MLSNGHSHQSGTGLNCASHTPPACSKSLENSKVSGPSYSRAAGLPALQKQQPQRVQNQQVAKNNQNPISSEFSGQFLVQAIPSCGMSALQKQQLQPLQDQQLAKNDKKRIPSRFWGQFLVQAIPPRGMSALPSNSYVTCVASTKWNPSSSACLRRCTRRERWNLAA